MSDFEATSLANAERSGTRYARILSVAGSLSLTWCLMTPLIGVGIQMMRKAPSSHFWLFSSLGLLNMCCCLWLWNREIRRFHAAARVGEPPRHGSKKEVMLVLGQVALTVLWMSLGYQYGHFLARVCYWLPLVMLSVTMLPRWGFILVVVAGIGMHFTLEHLIHESSFYPKVFLETMMIGLTAIWALVLESSMRWHSRVNDTVAKLVKAHEEVERQAEEIARLSALQERHRLAREVHDVVGNSLTVIAVQLDVAALCLPTRPADALTALQKARDTAQEGLAEMRLAVTSIANSLPEGLSLVKTVELLAERLRRPGFAVSVQVRGTPVPLNPALESTLYRCAQEAMTNVVKHSGSAQATLTLNFEQPGTVGLTISDKGCGLPSSLSEGGGFHGMRERVRDLRGKMNLSQNAEGGAQLHFQFAH